MSEGERLGRAVVLLLAALPLALACQTARGQTTGSIEGRVADAALLARAFLHRELSGSAS